MIVTTNPAYADHAVTIRQFRLHDSIYVKYIWSFFSWEKRIDRLFNPKNIHTHTIATLEFPYFSLPFHYISNSPY